jgi:prepilin peptidase CpaA
VQNVPTVALLIVLALAVLRDMKAHRIPNMLTATAVLAGLSLGAAANGFSGLLFSLAGVAAGIATLLPFYLLRGMGAGDVKLMGAVGSFVGAKAVLVAACATLALGVLIGVAVLAARWWNRSSQKQFPYAVVIAGGSLVALAYLGHLHRLAGVILGWPAS